MKSKYLSIISGMFLSFFATSVFAVDCDSPAASYYVTASNSTNDTIPVSIPSSQEQKPTPLDLLKTTIAPNSSGVVIAQGCMEHAGYDPIYPTTRVAIGLLLENQSTVYYTVDYSGSYSFADPNTITDPAGKVLQVSSATGGTKLGLNIQISN